MENFSTYGTSTAWSESPACEWGEVTDTTPLLQLKQRARRSLDASAFPGLVITREVSENEEHRRVISDILSRFAAEGAIARTTMHAAQCFIEALPRDRRLPTLAPDGDGGVVLAWEVPRDGRTLITLSDWIAYAVARAGTRYAEYLDDMPFDGVLVPDDLLAIIPT